MLTIEMTKKAVELLDLGYTYPDIEKETGITGEDASAVADAYDKDETAEQLFRELQLATVLAKACRKNYTLQNPDSRGSPVFRGFGGSFHPGGPCNFNRGAVRTNTGGPQRSMQGGPVSSARSDTWSREKLESRGRHSLGSARLRLASRCNQNLAGLTAGSVTAGLNT
jgi:hypothetical protein